MAPACDHLRVLIHAIVQAWDSRTHSRLIRGHCQNCSKTVQRVDGAQPTHWEAAK